MIFVNPFYLSLLIILPLILFFMARNGRPGKKPGVIHYSNIQIFTDIKPTGRVRMYGIMPWLTVTALTAMILALARPQLGLKRTLIRREGVDIILALDISSSMLAEDFMEGGKRTNRLEAVKKVARHFIKNRPNDRIGIVVFAGRAYILSPLSWDHDWSISRLKELNTGMIQESGTAIGSALATAVNRLRESTAKSKVIILLTDGINNAGMIMPETAGKSAKQHGIVIYTIGAGSKGIAPVPVFDAKGHKSYRNEKVDIDEALLTRIADMTGGRYFRAIDTQSLEGIFDRINRMARTSMEAPRYGEYLEIYPYLLAVALLLLLSEAVLSNTIYRRLP